MSLFVFDKDGTLVSRRGGWIARRKPPTRPEHQFVRRHVVETLAALRRDGHRIAIATNVNAVAYGAIDVAVQCMGVIEEPGDVGGAHGETLCERPGAGAMA